MAAPMFGQSLTTGSISGTVFDPSHAVVPNASVGLKSLDTGATQTDTSNSTGAFSFPLLKPGNYQITVKQAGFAELTEHVQVQIGQTTKADVNLSVSKGTETVEVSGTAPLVNTDPSINTTFSQDEVAQLPSAGGDITNIADTAPGVVVNGTGGYGNFTVNGLPATSNLFTVNGENDMDPYFNINNSGATNLTLGQNEIGEATVVTNPYSAQYGQLSGAQVIYATKSGSNTFHGNAQYWWNGRLLNANNWMNKEFQLQSGQPNQAPFSNANQYAASFGGPLIKNKTFFFVDYEGLRFVLPNVLNVNIPTAAFATAVLNNVTNLEPAEAPTYQTMLGLWANAPGAAGAQTNAADAKCAAIVLPGWDPSQGCTATFSATPTALAWEYIFAVRLDQKLGQNDNMFVRYKLDHGLQPTYLDGVSSKFDALSKQPSWDTQVQETHVFGPTKTNAFTAALSHYVAQFQQGPQALATFGYGQAWNVSTLDNLYAFNPVQSFPQGRNITQYQFLDDFSWTRGNHTLKFGANFRRYDVSDHNFFYNNPRVYWGYSTPFQAFADGLAYQYRQADNIASNVPVALWGIGLYGQDEWKASRNLKLTLALRVERNSNPVCQINCFANFTAGGFNNLASTQAAAAGQDPTLVNYSSDIKYGQHQAYPGVDKVVISPRIGFSWDPRGNGKTVLSGGFGIFYDSPAAGVVDSLLLNPPVSVTFRVRNGAVGVAPFDPAGAPNTYAQAAAAFNVTSNYNTIATNLAALGVSFPAPAFNSIVGTVKAPEWQEWNFMVQQELSRTLALSVNYVGNHGARIPYTNAWPNAYDPFELYGGTTIPYDVPPVANYGTVTETRSGAVSNYNGLTFSLRKQFNHWISAHLNYTWSHNIDENSNGGVFTYGDSVLGQIFPVNLRTSNYGNSDYDIRHLVNGDFVFNPEFHKTGPIKWLINGWQFSGKMFWRTGLPYAITDGNLNGAIFNGGNTTFADVIGPVQTGGCGKSNANYANSATPCLLVSGLFDTFDNFPNGYSTQRRNQYRGPHFFDMDLNLFKNFKIAERFNLAIGAQAFNAFNHPNFNLPDNTYNGPGDTAFGTISTMQGVPTSPYGNFLGFDSSTRVMQVTAKVVF
jgi:outer membrane receptor protein involved in Fe transport